MSFPVGAVLGAAGISAGANLISGLFTNKSNAKQAQLNREFTERMIDKQNEYNSPVNQANLYRQAGLNPALTMGNAGMASAGSGAAGSDVGRAEAPDFSGLGQGAIAAGQQYLAEKLNESVINKNNSEAEGQELQNKMLGLQYQVQGFKQELELAMMNKDLDAKELNNEYQRLNNKWFGDTYDSRKGIVDEQYKQEIVRTAISDLERQLKEFDVKYVEPERIQRLAQMRAEVASLYAQAFASRKAGELSEEQKDVARNLANKYREEGEQLGIRGKSLQKFIDAELTQAEEEAKRLAAQNLNEEQYGADHPFWNGYRRTMNTITQPLRGIFSGSVGKTIK